MNEYLSSDDFPSPMHFRLTSVMRLPATSGRGVHNEATLYHDDLQIRVAWHSATVDSRLKHGCLVLVRGMPLNPQLRRCSTVVIERLDLLDKPLASLNLFHTVPDVWVKDRAAVEQAADLWRGLNRPFKHLLNAVLWDGGRFHRFVTGPACLSDRPWSPGGNFRLAVDAAEQARLVVRGLPDVSPSVVVSAALLMRVGKADEYRLSEDHYSLSDRGHWVGAQYTILEWLAVARAKVIVPEAQYLALVHALIAARGEPADRQSLEATILAVATRLADQRPQLAMLRISRNVTADFAGS